MNLHKQFDQATVEEQVDFFVHCQALLIAHHPESPFVCRKENLAGRLHHMKNFVAMYKGMVYADEHVGVLYNRVKVDNPKEPELSLRANLYKPPNPDYNAIVVDFVVFRDLRDCLEFVRKNYEARVKYVMFVRHHKVKIYPVTDFLSQFLNVPTM